MRKPLILNRVTTRQEAISVNEIEFQQRQMVVKNNRHFIVNALKGCHIEFSENEKILSRDELLEHPMIEVIQHPMVRHKLDIARDKNTGSKDFRELITEIAMALTYEATRGLPLEEYAIETPVSMAIGKRIGGKKLAAVPILRAGLGIYQGVNVWIPSARVGHIGLYRKEDLTPEEYYNKLPSDCRNRDVFVLDPMLATGGSAVAAVADLKKCGCKNIQFLSIVSAPEGINAMLFAHPDVKIWTAAIDYGLTADGYILPGLGDAGDRFFGTK